MIDIYLCSFCCCFSIIIIILAWEIIIYFLKYILLALVVLSRDNRWDERMNIRLNFTLTLIFFVSICIDCSIVPYCWNKTFISSIFPNFILYIYLYVSAYYYYFYLVVIAFACVFGLFKSIFVRHQAATLLFFSLVYF